LRKSYPIDGLIPLFQIIYIFYRKASSQLLWRSRRRPSFREGSNRHGLQESNICIICDQAVETMDHIILGYVFSREVWASCMRRFRPQDQVLVQESDIMQWWTDSRRCLPKSIRRGFDSLFFLVGWTLWKERNARTFNGTPRSVAQLLQVIEDEITMWTTAGCRHLGALDSLRRAD
jgi:hypothetical protein